ncbi:golgin subfamily A member 4 isoform X3 [Teleopsis dalmanni]|uniref:golgin subfamily A member 4 isoform X3 n=1 Tax=Teleopsis dalmanni TaxID=139649 RepID=UPI0018CD6217|nr:golgin subfamily A member 4 isoform X3 [Teleopsis dalmanni]
MSKIHITSFLRPRGRFKSIEDSEEELLGAQESLTSENNSNTAPPTNNVVLIPTLNFIIGKSVTTTNFDTQHVAATCDYESIDNDNDSKHTYVISTSTQAAEALTATTTTTDTEELLQREVNLSLTDATSYFDEPTSSITIEMNNTTQSTTTGLTTTESSARRNSSNSAMATTTTASSDQSIEEEIEEALEISEVIDDDDDGIDDGSLVLSEAAGYSKQNTNSNIKSLQQFSVITDSEERSKTKVSQSKNNTSDEDQFKIDDEQLSGGKIAQHFVLDEEDDDDDDDEEKYDDKNEIDDDDDEQEEDFGDLSISLPLEKRLVHSQHKSTEHESEEHKESLTNQSTTDDVSDLIEEARLEEENITTHEDDEKEEVTQSTVDDSSRVRSKKTDNVLDLKKSMSEKTNKSTHEDEKDEGTTEKSSKLRSTMTDNISGITTESKSEAKNMKSNEDEKDEDTVERSSKDRSKKIDNISGIITESKSEEKNVEDEKDETTTAKSSRVQSQKNADVSDVFEPTETEAENLETLEDDENDKKEERTVEESSKLQSKKISEEKFLTTPPTTQSLSESIKLKSDTNRRKHSLSHSSDNEKCIEMNENSQLSGASSVHSEKDHSIEEIVEANHSVELSFDVKDLSSLNPSFDIHNESVVNRLLADTPEQVKSVGKDNSIKALPQTHEVEMSKVSNKSAIQATTTKLSHKNKLESVSNAQIVDVQIKPQIITDLDEQMTEDVHIDKSKATSLEEMQNSKSILELQDNNKPLNAIQIDNKLLQLMETLELKPLDEQVVPMKLPLITEQSFANKIQNVVDEQKDFMSTNFNQSLEVEDDNEDNSLELMKLRLLAMKFQIKDTSDSPNELSNNLEQTIKQMERVPLNELTKDVLEDITEESERNSLSTAEEQQSLDKSNSSAKSISKNLHVDKGSSNSIISLSMIHMAEQKPDELENLNGTKDAYLASLNLQLDASQRRESNGGISTEQPGSGRDTSSILTSSTEYRTFQEDFGGPTMDILIELSKRDELITKLSDSLQHSINVRENLQSEGEKLNMEIQLLRKQLADALESQRRSYWPREHESGGGQRISEISMDLVSESDDDLEQQFLTDNDDKFSRNSRERQLSIPRQNDINSGSAAETDLAEWLQQAPFSKQIEQFQKYLTPNEVRLFFMVQKKFDDFLSSELEKCKMKCEHEVKLSLDQLQNEKQERDVEIKRLTKLLEEKKSNHAKELDDLRKYFETKCADLEKQFSDDVFSQKSQLHGSDSSSSECSDHEQMPEDIVPISANIRAIEKSPKKRTRAELLLSPSHRQMTPSTDALFEDEKGNNLNLSAEINELKSFYQNKIHEIQRHQADNIRQMKERIKYYESRYPEDDFMSTTKNTTTTSDTTNTTVDSIVVPHVNDLNTSLIIIDQDELNMNNESQVIQQIIEQYECRLQEQLTLARKDIVIALEQQIQTLLSENTSDDHHWPRELILLREKFTAKSQLEIAQLQIKHEEEMSRLKLEYEKQLNRKNKRHTTFDLARNYEEIISERDGLRELSCAFRYVLSELAKCVSQCEEDANTTLVDEVQRILANNRTLEEHVDDLDFNLNMTLNTTLNSTSKNMRFVPDVQNILEVVEDPSLLQYISNKSGECNDEFDLKDCLQRLKTEASYLLHLSEDLQNRRKRQRSESSGGEKSDSCCEAESDLKERSFIKTRKFLRTNSLNEQHLTTYQKTVTTKTQLNSLPPDLNTIRVQGSGTSSTSGGNVSEINFQLHELKNRLIKSESDRLKLQQELEHTIHRNAELGQELQNLRDQISQLNSLNHTDYAEGYGLGSLKSPRQSGIDQSSSFAQLQEKARNILSTPTQKKDDNNTTVVLLQMIEDFCREGEKVVECNKKDRDDLQSQVKGLESNIRELTQQLQESNAKREKFEVELKASIDKIFVLREIITELETQVETKALNEHVLGEKVKEMESFIFSQTRSNETLQNEVISLKTEIDQDYQERIRGLEEKLQNIRPTAEQSMVLDQVVEQLRDIETTLDNKTKTLESLHNTDSLNSCSISVTEDVSVHGARAASLPTTMVSPPQLSPVHPSPRQHSLTMEGVQRIADKLSKHSRVEEAAIKRIRDLEMQITQMRAACVELQHERDSLQERMSEQSQRISVLQTRLEEQRKRAEELQYASTSDLKLRIHDLQTNVQSLQETLSSRDKEIEINKQNIEKSKKIIEQLEAEIINKKQPDRSLIDDLEKDIKQKNNEIQKLKAKIKNDMINKLAVPDLMETMLADKNEEIDHLKEQLESKEKELQAALDFSQASSLGGVVPKSAGREDASNKLSARTLSDIVSITEFDEPDVARRAALNNIDSPLLVPEEHGGFFHQTMETSKEAVANLTHKRTEDLSGFATLHPANTFQHPHYFQDPHLLQASQKSGATMTPPMVPRQINFSALTEDSKLKTPDMNLERQNIEKMKTEISELKTKLTDLKHEKDVLRVAKDSELEMLKKSLITTQEQLEKVQGELQNKEKEFIELQSDNKKCTELQQEISAKLIAIAQLEQKQTELEQKYIELIKDNKIKTELLKDQEEKTKYSVELEERSNARIKELELKVLTTIETEVNKRENLRKEFESINSVHQNTVQDLESRKQEIENLNKEIKAKDERLLLLTTKLSISEDNITGLQRQIDSLEREVEKLRQQQNSENSSKQYSVDEIAQQVEKELNYSAQLDSSILKAIESEEENNLDSKHLNKESQLKHESQGTDDENFTGERELLNQLEALKVQVAVEREQNEIIRRELLLEKQHSQEIQEQDVVIIEAMRKRLETALDQEDDLNKQLDNERERCDRLQTQLTALQRAESRRNSSLLLKSPNDSPRKSPRSLSDYETELAERLRREIKLMTAQNERERERYADLQRSGERERQRYESELKERVEYSDKLKKEMETLLRDKDSAELECEHLQERLTLQTQEIESLESRLATMQETETRRTTRRERQQKENAQLLAEIQELKLRLETVVQERESLTKHVSQLRYDIERSAQREAKLAESLANANSKLANIAGDDTVPQQFLLKMKEINMLLAENTQENRQMAETVQFMVEERRQLQKKCEELEAQIGGQANVSELEERCNYLLARYLRVESHRKALVYQKRYLKVSLQSYQALEERTLAYSGRSVATQKKPNKEKLFKTVALAIIAIQRMKYIGRVWKSGKRIVSKSVFTITQQKRTQPPTISCAAVSSTSPTSPVHLQNTQPHHQHQQQHQQQQITQNNNFATMPTNFNEFPVTNGTRNTTNNNLQCGWQRL